MKDRDQIMAEIKRLDTEIELNMRKEAPQGMSRVEFPKYVMHIIELQKLFWVLEEKIPDTRNYTEGTWDWKTEDEDEKANT